MLVCSHPDLILTSFDFVSCFQYSSVEELQVVGLFIPFMLLLSSSPYLQVGHSCKQMVQLSGLESTWLEQVQLPMVTLDLGMYVPTSEYFVVDVL